MDSTGTDSWCWKSLLRAREILEVGLRKRVGDGKSISIWEDRWLPDSADGKIKTKRKEGLGVSRVSDLIQEGKWSKELIAQVFEEQEGKEILRIPLSVYGRKDNVYWSKSSSGEYTVKSGYRLARGFNGKGDHGGSGAESSGRRRCTPQGWNFLWGLKVKHKLKHFIWKCLQRILPVNAVIKERCSRGDSGCKCCGEYQETIEHLLFFCDNAMAIWKIAPVSWGGLECLRNNFGHWWEEIREAGAMESGQERIELTVNVLWQIWKSRNRRQFEGKGMDPMTVVNKATREWREFQEVQNVDGGTGNQRTSGKEGLGGWKEPEEGWVKINSDAAVQQKTERAGWGMIARDCLGNALGAWAVPNTSCSSAMQEEALALRAAMLMAKQ